MKFNDLMRKVLEILPDATLWQDHDGEICVSTKLAFAKPVKVDEYGDEELAPMQEEA